MVTPSYAAVLVAVPIEQIDEVRALLDRPDEVELVASEIAQCPHELIEVEVFPLGKVLTEAIDIGQPLRNDAWHPLRAPIVVDPETVAARARKLDQALDQARDEMQGLMGEAVGADIDRVCQLYSHAARRGEAIVTFLAADDATPVKGALVPHVRVG